MPPTERKQIVIGDDGSATYTRTAILPGATETDPPRTRDMETRKVDLDALFPEEGQLILYPHGCRYAKRHGAITVFAIEAPPQVRSLNWRADGASYREIANALLRSPPRGRRPNETEAAFLERLQRQASFRIALPYLIFIVRFNGPQVDRTHLFFRTAPLRDGNDELYRSNLPNQNAGELCLTHRAKTLSSSLTMAEATGILLEEFWMGSWNSDWLTHFLAFGARNPSVESPWDWELASTKDPSFVLRLPWEPTGETLGSFVRKQLAETAETSTFDAMVRRVQAADAWTGTRAPQDRLRNSPSSALALQSGPIRIGQYLIARAATLSQLAVDGHWAIQWFGLADASGGRDIKLDGIDRPLPLIRGNRLLPGLEVSDRPPTPPPTLDGTILKQGTRIWFHDRSLWERLPSHPIPLVRAETLDDGRIGALFPNRGDLEVVGKDSQALPGILIVDPNEHGVLRWASAQAPEKGPRLTVGQKYTFFRPVEGDIFTGTLQRFRMQGADPAADFERYTVSLLQAGLVWLSEGDAYLPHPDNVPLPKGMHVAANGGLCPIERGFQLRGMSFIQINGAWWILDERKIRNLPWAEGGGLHVRNMQKAVLNAGDQILIPTPGMEKAKTDGDALTITAISEEERTKLPILVLSDGSRMAATAGNLRRIRRRGTRDKWAAIPQRALEGLPMLNGYDYRPRRGEGMNPGTAPPSGGTGSAASAPARIAPMPGTYPRVRYLGGGKAGKPDFNEDQAKRTPATIVGWSTDRVCRLRFDRNFSGLEMDAVTRGRPEQLFTHMSTDFLSVDDASPQPRLPGT